MATIQTAALIDGRWTTQNVDVDTVLKRNGKEEEVKPKLVKPPCLGILTQTVIESPVTHWILPVRLKRDANQNLAFVGDHLVRIFRLCNDGQIQEVARKADFGSRIRNAHTMAFVELGITPFSSPPPQSLTDDCGDMFMPTDSRDHHRPLPPECLVLALESGDLVFVFARWLQSGLDFVTSRHPVSRPMLSEQPGKHMAIDPSSRYIAIACSEKHFAVFSLHAEEVLSTQHVAENPFRPVKSERYFSIDGVIHQMEFIHPTPNDPNHMILLLMVVRRGNTRIMTFEWDASQSLREIRSNNKQGHLVPPAFRMPLFLIPLSIRSAVIMACEEVVVACEGLLEGFPTYRTLDISPVPPTPFHIGRGRPLWTSWTKPMRRRDYTKRHDDFYLAREDGVIKFLEMDISEDDLLKVEMHAGELKCNIGTAFTSLGQIGRANDILISGGESSDGGVYQIFAKSPAELVGRISNCSPILDFVTVSQSDNLDEHEPSSARAADALPEPDRVFACTGKGFNGAATEFRYGCEARLRLAMAELDVIIMGAWALPYHSPAQAHRYLSEGMPLLFLLSAGDRSLLLHLAPCYQSITEISQSNTSLDLSSRTLIAESHDGCTIQVTEKSIVVSVETIIRLKVFRDGYAGSPTNTESRVPHQSPSTLRRTSIAGETIVAAALYLSQLVMVAYTTSHGEIFLRLFQVYTVDQQPFLEAVGEPLTLHRCPNCLYLTKFGGDTPYALAGFTDSASDKSMIDMYKLDEKFAFTHTLPIIPNHKEQGDSDSLQDACVSLAVLFAFDSANSMMHILLAGYRSGMLIASKIVMEGDGHSKSDHLFRGYIGTTPAVIKPGGAEDSAVICCDSKVFFFQYKVNRPMTSNLRRVWVTDAANPAFQQPPLSHVAALTEGLLLTAGKQIFVSGFGAQAKPIPRSINLTASPTRITYSYDMKAIVVGLITKSGASLKLIDPDTGELIRPQDDGGILTIPPSYGRPSERVLCLATWQVVPNFRFLVAGTGCGQLLLYKVVVRNSTLTGDFSGDPADNTLRYVLHYHKQFDKPVSAVANHKNSIFVCVGDKLLWYTLDVDDGMLHRKGSQPLPSRGVSIRLETPWVHVLTANHSLFSFFATPDGSLIPQFGDEIARSGMDHLVTNHTDGVNLTIVSDKTCSVVGFWNDKSKQQVARDHRVIFEAELPTSIVKLRYAKPRPAWDITWKGLGTRGISPSPRGNILLGTSIDGSMTSFTILGEPLLRLLEFIQGLAGASMVTPSTFPESSQIMGSLLRPASRSRKRHIDGDLLYKCLAPGLLPWLIMGRTVPTMETGDSVSETFQRLVHNWWNATSRTLDEKGVGDMGWCFQQTHHLLDTLLRPVI